MNSEKQEPGTGQTPSPSERPSPAASRLTKTEPENLSESMESHSVNGSSGPAPKKTTESSENEALSGSKTTRQKKPKSLMPVPKLPPEENRESQALARLKVKREALQTSPSITPMIKSTVKGGLNAALEAMRFSIDDSDIRAFLRTYDKIPEGDREHLSWEAICLAGKVNPKHLLGAIELAVGSYCQKKSRLIAVSNHPEIMEKRVEFAKMAGGEKDRTALDIMSGMQQSPRGPTFVGKQVAVFNGPGATSKDDQGQVIEPKPETTTDGFEDLFPPPNDVQEKLVPIRQRLLEG